MSTAWRDPDTGLLVGAGVQQTPGAVKIKLGKLFEPAVLAEEPAKAPDASPTSEVTVEADVLAEVKQLHAVVRQGGPKTLGALTRLRALHDREQALATPRLAVIKALAFAGVGKPA